MRRHLAQYAVALVDRILAFGKTAPLIGDRLEAILAYDQCRTQW